MVSFGVHHPMQALTWGLWLQSTTSIVRAGTSNSPFLPTTDVSYFTFQNKKVYNQFDASGDAQTNLVSICVSPFYKNKTAAKVDTDYHYPLYVAFLESWPPELYEQPTLILNGTWLPICSIVADSHGAMVAYQTYADPNKYPQSNTLFLQAVSYDSKKVSAIAVANQSNTGFNFAKSGRDQSTLNWITSPTSVRTTHYEINAGIIDNGFTKTKLNISLAGELVDYAQTVFNGEYAISVYRQGAEGVHAILTKNNQIVSSFVGLPDGLGRLSYFDSHDVL